jgi:methyl-accepting chemotaxis protein
LFAFIRNTNLKMKLICSFAVVMLLPGMIIGYISYETSKAKVSEQLLRSADENVELLDGVITDTITSRIKDLEYMSGLIKSPDLTGATPEVRRYLEDYQKLHPEINTVFVGMPDKGFFNAPKTDLGADFDPTVRPWYLAAQKEADKVSVTAPYVSKTTGDFVIALSKTLRDGSGVIGAEIKLKNLETMTQSIKIGERGYAVLLDQQKKSIVHSDFSSGEDLTGEWVNTVFGAAEGDANYNDGSSSKRIRFTTNALTGWKIGGVIETSELSEQAAPILKNTLYVLIAAFVVFGALAVTLVWLITRPLKELGDAAVRISEGDLTQRAKVRGKDEIARLGNSFNAMGDSLRTLLSEISELSVQVAASSEELTASAEQTSKATEQIAVSIQEVAASASHQVKSVDKGFDSIRGMADGIGQISQGAGAVSKSADEASEHSGEGSAAMVEAINQMNTVRGQVDHLEKAMTHLNERSAAIGQIAEMMTGIAQQTNILSINASIEAARAGEHGKGFAVVAQEVKKLADQSRRSAEQIREMIESVRMETTAAVEVTESVVEGVSVGSVSIRHAGELFESIKKRLYQVADQSKSMSETVRIISDESVHAVDSMEQVSRSTTVTADNTHDVSSATEEQLASMEEIASSSAALAKMAENMQQLINRFKV